MSPPNVSNFGPKCLNEHQPTVAPASNSEPAFDGAGRPYRTQYQLGAQSSRNSYVFEGRAEHTPLVAVILRCELREDLIPFRIASAFRTGATGTSRVRLKRRQSSASYRVVVFSIGLQLVHGSPP